MDLTMRERIARAIVDALPMALTREEMDKAADAVLAAMREPDNEIKLAIWQHVNQALVDGSDRALIELWRAAIDAASANTGEEG